MQIIKRNGTTESYDREKIAVAIRKSFISTQKEITDEAVYTIVDEVEQFLHQNEANRSVERIQDEVERSLMEHGFYAEAKNYILYRWQRTERRKVLSQIITGTGDDTIANILKEIQKDNTRNSRLGIHCSASAEFPIDKETDRTGGSCRHLFIL